MTYSNYVLRTTINGEDALYHTLFEKWLPVNSSEESLKEGLFLAGQEIEAIEKRLYQREKRLKFFYISTWGCSLRCPFCFVLKQLKREDTSKLDEDKLYNFLTRFHDRYKENEEIIVNYLGGEPLMAIDNCIAMNKVVKRFCQEHGLKLSQTITTNGTIDVSDKMIEFLRDMSHITVSIDGDQENHDAQRKVYRLDILGQESQSPFTKTVRFVKSLCDHGLADTISINSALGEEIFADRDRLREFVFMLRVLGVRQERIYLCCLVPTQCQKVTEQYDTYLKHGFVFPKPCCCFQYMAYFCLHDNNLYGNYFATEGSFLGTTDSSIPGLANNYRKYIENTMPVLKDKTCMSCPVIGYCWGGCANSEILKENPSLVCGQELLISRVKKSAEDGTITDFAEKSRGLIDLCIKI